VRNVHNHKIYTLDSSPCVAAAQHGLIGPHGGIIQFRLASHSLTHEIAQTSKLLPVYGAHHVHKLGTVAKSGFAFVLAPPQISQITPREGPTTGGTMLTIKGRNLGLDANDERSITVTIGSAHCTGVEWISPTETRCKVPAGAGKQLPVHVTVGSKTSRQTDVSFSYHGPEIESVTPAYGHAGMTVTVKGKGFGVTDLKPVVTVGKLRCRSIKWISDTQLTCAMAQKNAGVYSITVLIDGQAVEEPKAIEVIAPVITAVEPKHGGAVGGEMITIRGAGFATKTFPSTTSVYIDGRPCRSATVVNPRRILCVAPELKHLDEEALITVKVSGVEASFKQGFLEMGIAITHVEPSAVDAAGRELITIHGSYFGTSRTRPVVHIGQSLCRDSQWIDDHRVTCVVPEGMKYGLYGVRISVNGLRGEKVGLLTLSPPTIKRIEPKAAASVGGELVTLFGSNFGSFDAKPEAFIGGKKCAETTWLSSGIVTCKVPRTRADAAEEVRLQVGRNSAVLKHGLQSSGVTISRVPPHHAAPKGGSVLSIHGSNFGPADSRLSAKIGSANCLRPTWHSDRLITCQLPRGLGANLTVSVRIDGIEGSLARAFSYDAPVITKLVPAYGPATGGKTTIHGSNFGWSDSHPTITLGEGHRQTPCQRVEWISDTRLTCHIPASLAGTMSIKVDVQGNVGSATDAYQVVEPVIDSIIPSSVPAYGGERITLSGKNFGHVDPAARITIGDLPCGSVTWQDDRTISCEAPAARAGKYDVHLKLLNSSWHQASKHSAFTMHGPTIFSLAPKKLPATGGVVLTLHGKYFGSSDGVIAPPKVTLSGEPCEVVDWHDVLLKCEVKPMNAGWADVSVHLQDNDAKFLSGVYLSPPVIKLLKPSSIAVVGSTPLTIIGENFGVKDSKPLHPVVTISGAACAEARWVSDRQITCQPSVALGEGHKDVSVRVGGNTSPHSAKLWMNGPEVKTILPLHGPHQGGEVITIVGSGFGAGSYAPKISLNNTECLDAKVINDTLATCTTSATPLPPPSGSSASVNLEIAGFKSRSPTDYTFDWCSNSTAVYHISHTSYNAYCAPELCSFREHDLGQMTIKFEDVNFRTPLRRASLVLTMTLDDRSTNDPSRYSIDVKLNGHALSFNNPLTGIEHGEGGNTVYPNSKTFDNFKKFTIELSDKEKQLLKSGGSDNTFVITVHTGWFGFVVVKKAELVMCS
jgi:hypothetical protein